MTNDKTKNSITLIFAFSHENKWYFVHRLQVDHCKFYDSYENSLFQNALQTWSENIKFHMMWKNCSEIFSHSFAYYWWMENTNVTQIWIKYSG